MVGGTEADFASARDVFDVLAKRVFHVGEQGAGATMKLAVNAVVHATNHALAEALVLAEKAGVDRATAYEVFASSAIASPFVLYKREAFERPGDAPVAFSVDLVAKDYALILALAERVGAVMDQATTGRATAVAAIEAGLGQHDMSALAELLRAGSAASAG
jgi:3-hydroxyisobutyrate dehydrogenase-like beta-hydroxyacid dehydrogenase